MGRQSIARFLPGYRRDQNRSPLFLVVGGLALLALCLFTTHLPALPHLTGFRPFGGNAGEYGMTSPGPHHDGSSEVGLLLEESIELAKEKLETLTMEYGTNKHPPFKDDPPLLVKDLPQEHIPSYRPPSSVRALGEGEDRVNGKRLVVVGDVHGQLGALKALLKKIGFDHKHGDHLVLAGDMVTKGPDSKGVLKLAMALGASAVRGNQDDRVLAAARELHRWSANDNPGSDDVDVSEVEDADGEVGTDVRVMRNHAHRVARSLTRAQLAWLGSLPIILRIGHLPDAASPPWNASTLAVVHGGLVPGVHLEEQDPWAVMNMRSFKYPRKGKGKNKGKHHSQSQQVPADDNEEQPDHLTTAMDDPTLPPDTVAVPVDTHDGEPWSHAWNRYQNHLHPSSPHTTLVIYGHDAKAGLQTDPEADISPYSPSPPKHKNKNKSETQTNKKHKKQKKKNKGHRYAYGLDSGCGHGRQLTALVIEAVAGSGVRAGQGAVRHRIEQVDCADPGAVVGAGGVEGEGQMEQWEGDL
ncbi:Metallo-dependent phosphatase-like protein [Chaetomium fimeti]|uniref:Metallo-dependent phosphatase-like protein n=1 Tax=Chaetomium fimeti TaxID=1854472 RepID=A0AAE0HLG3_9PEZI|nr:Metallo-dependent phosphatase-like protein [Chaetomium fimeti]